MDAKTQAARLLCDGRTSVEVVAAIIEERDQANEMIGRVQQAAYDACKRVDDYCGKGAHHRIDGAGSDGDEADFTGSEVAQAIRMVGDLLDEERAAHAATLARLTKAEGEKAEAEATLSRVVDNIRGVVPYVTATLSTGEIYLTSERPEWIKIHGGRAQSSINQLENLRTRALSALASVKP